MGIRDGAAEGLASRLEMFGVPAVIGAVIGQCAYLPERKRHTSIPTPIVRGSEITYLVDQYVNQLRVTFDPVAKTALVQGLCVRIFGPNAERVFIAGYPELSPENLRKPAEGPGEPELETQILASAGRYFQDGFDPGSPSNAQAVASVHLKSGLLPGFLIFMNNKLCFFDAEDLSYEDVTEGSPVMIEISDIRSCKVYLPETLPTDAYGVIDRGEYQDDAVLDVQLDHKTVRFSIPISSVDEDMRDDAKLKLRLILYVLDREILRWRELIREVRVKLGYS